MSNQLSSAVQQQLLEQIAEQTKSDAIKDMHTKSGMLASLLLGGSAQLWIGSSALSTGHSCAPHLHWWLACDGAATSAGMLLGLAALNKGTQIARGIEARKWFLANGEERDAMSELTGAWRRVCQLSDAMDLMLLTTFLSGCYFYSTSVDSGDGCTGRSWVLLALMLKPVAPISVTIAFKVHHLLSGSTTENERLAVEARLQERKSE